MHTSPEAKKIHVWEAELVFWKGRGHVGRVIFQYYNTEQFLRIMGELVHLGYRL